MPNDRKVTITFLCYQSYFSMELPSEFGLQEARLPVPNCLHSSKSFSRAKADERNPDIFHTGM